MSIELTDKEKEALEYLIVLGKKELGFISSQSLSNFKRELLRSYTDSLRVIKAAISFGFVEYDSEHRGEYILTEKGFDFETFEKFEKDEQRKLIEAEKENKRLNKDYRLTSLKLWVFIPATLLAMASSGFAIYRSFSSQYLSRIEYLEQRVSKIQSRLDSSIYKTKNFQVPENDIDTLKK